MTPGTARDVRSAAVREQVLEGVAKLLDGGED
jgi:hypothetical protein